MPNQPEVPTQPTNHNRPQAALQLLPEQREAFLPRLALRAHAPICLNALLAILIAIVSCMLDKRIRVRRILLMRHGHWQPVPVRG